MNQDRDKEPVERMGLIKSDSQAALDLFHEHAKEDINNLIWRFAPPDLYIEEADEMALTLWRSLSEAWDRSRARAGEMAVKLTVDEAAPPRHQIEILETTKSNDGQIHLLRIGDTEYLWSLGSNGSSLIEIKEKP